MDSVFNEVQSRISSRFGENVDIDFKDEKGDGKHFFLSIVSEEFIGQTRVARSQMVYAILDELMKTGLIHALRMNLKTPEEAIQK